MSDQTNVVYNNSKKSESAEKEPSNDLLKQAQQQADELLKISRHNVDQVLERGQKLSDLNEISKALEEGAGEFVYQTKTIQRKKWLKHIKRKVAVCSLIVILLIFVILLTVQRISS